MYARENSLKLSDYYILISWLHRLDTVLERELTMRTEIGFTSSMTMCIYMKLLLLNVKDTALQISETMVEM